MQDINAKIKENEAKKYIIWACSQMLVPMKLVKTLIQIQKVIKKLVTTRVM